MWMSGVAVGARHLGVDLGDDAAGVSTAARAASTDTPREQKPWASGGETCTSATSRGSDAVAKEGGHLAQEHRDVVGAAGGHGLARARPDEERVVSEVARERGREVRCGAVHVQVHDLHARDLGPTARERLEQRGGRHRGLVHEDAVTGLDGGERLVGADDLHGATLSPNPTLGAWRRGGAHATAAIDGAGA
jgi:hypothetical protein